MTLRILCIALLLVARAAPAGAAELTGFVSLEYRGYWSDPLFIEQHHHEPSVVLQPEFYHEWNAGDDIFTFTPFFRYDVMDNRRTHPDIRELSWLHVGDDWEMTLGISKVFWGVTEVQHLVDIINQTDLVEDIDNEDRLGQPMLRLAYIHDWGTLTFFTLPGFRERTFPGDDGHFRAFEPIDVSDAEYESGAEWRHVDFALRYAHTFGDFDVGIAHFYGTSREPRIVPRPTATGLDLHPYYDIIQQTSLDVQATLDNWLWKLEAIYRTGHGPEFWALTGGLEYSFYGVFDTDVDVGIVAEGMYDHRDMEKAPQTQFQRDGFLGLRLGFNDVQSTEFLGGAVYDFEYQNITYFVEASRRIGDRWKIELDIRIFSRFREGEPGGFLRRDDHAQLRLSRFF